MSNLVDLAVPLAAFEQRGFDDRSEAIKTSRLKNREALMKISDEMASRGVQMSVEDMAKQAQDLLGPADWLYSMSPSQDVLAGMTASQNALASKAQEEQRRSKFANDMKESQDMKSFAAESFMAGDDPATVLIKGQEMFGAERFNKVAPNLTRIQGEASFRGMQEGMNVGKAMLLDEADEYISQNKSFLPQATQDGIRKAAQANQANAEREIISAASQLGDQGKFTDNAVDAENLRSMIKTRFPTMSQDAVEGVQKKALDAARAAYQGRVMADDRSALADSRKIAAQGDAQMFLAAQQAEERDLAMRDQRAQAFSARGAGVLEGQQKLRADIIGDKKKGIEPMIKDSAHRAQVLQYLDTYKVDDFDGLKAAVESGDQKKIKQVLAGMETLASYQERTQIAARLTTARIASPQEFYAIGAGLGARATTIEDMGKKYKADLDAAQKSMAALSNQPSVKYPGGSSVERAIGWGVEKLTSAPASESESSMAAASRQAAETRINGLVATTASQLKALREAASINQSIGMTPEQIVEQERKLAYGVAQSFLRGAGQAPGTTAFELAVETMADDILKAAGAPTEVRRRPTAQDNINAYRANVAGGQGVQRESRVPSGAMQPNARAGYAAGTAPPPF